MSISCTGYISFTPSSRHFFSLDSLFQLITTSFPTQMHLPGCVSHFNPLNNFTISHNLTHMPHQFFSVPILFCKCNDFSSSISSTPDKKDVCRMYKHRRYVIIIRSWQLLCVTIFFCLSTVYEKLRIFVIRSITMTILANTHVSSHTMTRIYRLTIVFHAI